MELSATSATKLLAARAHRSFQIGQRDGEEEIEMKKFWLATVGLLALGMAAPASAADLAARPYTKAPPAPVVPIYDWSGF